MKADTVPQLIVGNSYIDERGKIRFFNDISLNEVKRFYVIEGDQGKLRAWQAHKIEQKYFFVVQGKAKICAVKLNDFDLPADDLSVDVFILNEDDNTVLFLPGGYANGIQLLSDNTKLIVFSTSTLEESIKDTYRFDSKLWYNWDLLENG